MCQLDWAMGYPDIWSEAILVGQQGCFWVKLVFTQVD